MRQGQGPRARGGRGQAELKLGLGRGCASAFVKSVLGSCPQMTGTKATNSFKRNFLLFFSTSSCLSCFLSCCCSRVLLFLYIFSTVFCVVSVFMCKLAPDFSGSGSFVWRVRVIKIRNATIRNSSQWKGKLKVKEKEGRGCNMALDHIRMQ